MTWKVKDEEGFEGNAQSFRIINKLAVRGNKYPGLNLTAATLNGVLNYPTLRAPSKRKWGAYHTEKAVFDWARRILGAPRAIRSVEAELMDWADDIAYSDYDVDDFFRAGLIPLGRLFSDDVELQRFLEGATQRLKSQNKDAHVITNAVAELLVVNFPPISMRGDFEGTIGQRALLREWTGRLVTRYVNAIRLKVPRSGAVEATVAIDPELKNEVEGLKQLVWHYVIENPPLLTQQHGQRTIIRSLFMMYVEKAQKKHSDFFPKPYRQMLKDSDASGHVRTVVDMICAMTETQANRLYQRLSGVSIGSIYDHV